MLAYVNDTCVLGYTHQDVVTLFQSIPIDEDVMLEVCRGYPLPFDPDDPNTEIVTTVAVSRPSHSTSSHQSPPAYSSHHRGDSPQSGPQSGGLNMNQRNIKSMPDLSNSTTMHELGNRNKSFDDDYMDQNSSRPELYTIPIVKGTMGFGFTIADSAYGQKVKQILDRPRCKTLQEGDILVEINGIKVKDLTHADVVEVLKGCPKGNASDVVIQRGGKYTMSSINH